jgi:hypothetical protein
MSPHTTKVIRIREAECVYSFIYNDSSDIHKLPSHNYIN